MKSRSKAPLRIGLAGGGTDVSPYTDLFGGEVVNAAISLYARCIISGDHTVTSIFKHEDLLPVSDGFTINSSDPVYELHNAVLTRFNKEFNVSSRGLIIETTVDVPLGSGLGTSSTLMVAILGALLQHHAIQLSKDQIAALAYQIEREDLKHAGGRQDQYAACHGGINHMLFDTDGSARVEKLRVSNGFISRFRDHLILYYTSHNRRSGEIIEEQIAHVENRDQQPLEAMHFLKKQSQLMRQAFERENIFEIANLIDLGFAEKKKMAAGISNPAIEEIYHAAKNAGALAGKISGAGGGGFMVFCVKPEQRDNVIRALLTFGGTEYPFHFDQEGLITWSE